MANTVTETPHPRTNPDYPEELVDLPLLNSVRDVSEAFYGSDVSGPDRIRRLIELGHLAATRTDGRGSYVIARSAVLRYWAKHIAP